MACTNPLIAYESSHTWPSGKKKLVFNKHKSIDGLEIHLPCGRYCDSCLLAGAAERALRCEREASLYEDNTYLTLTYDNIHLPLDLSLDKEHARHFMKTLRNRSRGKTIRYQLCGEYGKATAKNNYIARPHFHLLIFNHAFDDLEVVDVNAYGDKLYNSEDCESMWGRGQIRIGELNSRSANYVARHNEKLLQGQERVLVDEQTGEKYYLIWNAITGEQNRVIPEYTSSSTHPGIGHDWYKRYKSDVYPQDKMYVGSYSEFPSTKVQPRFVKPPRYFDKLLEAEDPELMAEIVERRKQEAKRFAKDKTARRLESRARLAKIKRDRIRKQII